MIDQRCGGGGSFRHPPAQDRGHGFFPGRALGQLLTGGRGGLEILCRPAVKKAGKHRVPPGPGENGVGVRLGFEPFHRGLRLFGRPGRESGGENPGIGVTAGNLLALFDGLKRGFGGPALEKQRVNGFAGRGLQLVQKGERVGHFLRWNPGHQFFQEPALILPGSGDFLERLLNPHPVQRG